jgi:hypothetical protein
MPPPVSTSSRMHVRRWVWQRELIAAKLYEVLQSTICMAGQRDSGSLEPDRSIGRRVRAAYSCAWRNYSRLCFSHCPEATVRPPRTGR